MTVRYRRTLIKNGCVIGCLAMVTGESFHAVKRGMLEYWQEEGQFLGVSDEAFDEYLAQRGYATQYLRHEYTPKQMLRTPWPPAPWAPIHVCDVFDEGRHAVVMLEDGRVLDPNDRKRSTLAQYHRVFAVCGIWRVGDPPG
jgi:hypothetical protein